MSKAIEVEGLREFQQAIRKSVDRDLGKRMGQANKQVGTKIITTWLSPKSTPAAVGVGTGATIRPSATKREVILRVGGKHRAGHSPQMQWGKHPGAAVGRRPKRPYIQQSAQDHSEDIFKLWMEAVTQAMDPAFYKTDVS